MDKCRGCHLVAEGWILNPYYNMKRDRLKSYKSTPINSCQYRNACDSCVYISCRSPTFVSLLLIILTQQAVRTYSVSLFLKNNVKLNAIGITRKAVPGRNRSENITYTIRLCSVLFCSNIFLVILQLLISGDVHPNPGPESLSTSVSSTISYCSLLASHNLSIIHLNIQSLLPKISILEVEMQSYDILIFTETWLSPRISNDVICIPNFNPPYRKDRLGRQGGGVAIYTRIGIPSVERQDLLYYDLEAICVEVILKSHKYLVCGVYRPPDTGHEYWDLIEQTFDNMSTSSIDDLVIVGNFNCNMLNDDSFNKNAPDSLFLQSPSAYK